MGSERGHAAVAPTTVASGGAVAAHIALMHAQRAAVFEALAGVPEERFWERPAPKKWSPGEHLDQHHYRAVRCLLQR